MDKKEYLVQLDKEQFSWDFLWNMTIKDLKKYATTIEIISVLMGILLIKIDHSDLSAISEIVGIKVIEENSRMGTLCKC